MKRRWPLVFTAIVLATDLALINGSFVATSIFKFGTPFPEDPSLAAIYIRLQLFLNLILPLCLVLTGAYRDLWRSPLGHQTATAFKACLWAAAITATAMFLDRHTGYSRQFVTFQLFAISILVPFSRILLMRLSEAAHMHGYGVQHVLVVGEREPLRDLALFLRLAPHLGHRVEAVMPRDFEPEPERGGPTLVRGRDELEDLLVGGRIDGILICDREADRYRWKTVIDLAEEIGVETRLVRWPLLIPQFRARIHDLLTIPVVPEGVRIACHGAGAAAKRLMDVTGAAAALVVLSPVFLIIAAAIKLESRGPIFYRQRRLALGGRSFDMLKFRSMRSDAERRRASLEAANEASGPLFKMKDDPRVTRIGSLLRRLSLDELPQLLNVLRGDLSLVGPRPPLPEEAAQYEPWQRHRLDVPQGLTGLWQVSGRSRLGFEEMSLLDLYYIENWSVLLDVEILLETLPTVLQGDGAY